MFVKINPEDNFLMECQNKIDDSWSDGSDFVKQENGEFYLYYTDRLTPDLVSIQKELDSERRYDIKDALNKMEVVYGRTIYKIDRDMNIAIVIGLQKVDSSGETHLFDINHNLVMFDKRNLIGLVDEIHKQEKLILAK